MKREDNSSRAAFCRPCLPPNAKAWDFLAASPHPHGPHPRYAVGALLAANPSPLPQAHGGILAADPRPRPNASAWGFDFLSTAPLLDPLSEFGRNLATESRTEFCRDCAPERLRTTFLGRTCQEHVVILCLLYAALH